jgi:hypothetical protein
MGILDVMQGWQLHLPALRAFCGPFSFFYRDGGELKFRRQNFNERVGDSSGPHCGCVAAGAPSHSVRMGFMASAQTW